jgi:hypothetical protein
MADANHLIFAIFAIKAILETNVMSSTATSTIVLLDASILIFAENVMMDMMDKALVVIKLFVPKVSLIVKLDALSIL